MLDSNCIINKLSKSDLAHMKKDLNGVIVNLSPDEKVIALLKGMWREYLVCTNLQVYIVKRGMMTGNTFGGGMLKIAYPNITNAEVVYRAFTGYFEISAGGLENRYYTNSPQNDPSKQPNCMAIMRTDRKIFEEVSGLIMRKAAEAHNARGIAQIMNKSKSEEIREYKALYDDGIITKAEFEKKKKELLN